MAVSIDAHSYYNSGTTSTTAHSISYPSGVTSGDLLILWLTSNTTATFSTLGDWTLHADRTIGSASYPRFYMYYKIADGTESGSLTLTASTSCYCVAIMARISGYYSGNALTTANVSTSSGPASTVDVGASTDFDPTAATGMVFICTVVDGAIFALSPPSGYTALETRYCGVSYAGAGMQISYKSPVTTSDDPGNTSWTGGATYYGWIIAGVQAIGDYTIGVTLKDSSGTAVANGVRVLAVKASEVASVAAGGTLNVEDVVETSGGTGSATFHFYDNTNARVIFVDPNDSSSIDGETLITTSITPS